MFNKIFSPKLIIFRDLNFYTLNRKIRRTSKYKKLKQQLSEEGLACPVVVALIGGKYYIVDGQHRANAIHELTDKDYDVEISCIVDPEITDFDTLERKIKSANKASKDWDASDYLHSLAKDGKKPFVELSTKMYKYSKDEVWLDDRDPEYTNIFGTTTVAMIYSNDNSDAKIKAAFEEGTSFDYNAAVGDKVMTKVLKDEDWMEAHPFVTKSYFIQGVKRLYLRNFNTFDFAILDQMIESAGNFFPIASSTGKTIDNIIPAYNAVAGPGNEIIK